jgi:hypothetical protein
MQQGFAGSAPPPDPNIGVETGTASASGWSVHSNETSVGQ